MLTVRREEIAWLHSESVNEIVPIQERKDASEKLLDLMWVDTDKSVDPAHKKNRSRLCQRIQDEEAKQDSKSLTCFSVVLGNPTI